MKRSLLVILVSIFVLTLTSTAVFADDAKSLVSVTANYWMPSIDAEVQITDLSVIGSTIDIIDDLGLDDSNSIPALNASVDLPFLPEILLSYFAIDDSATKNITKTLSYKGKSYTVADQLTSSYDITQFEALLNFNIINMDAGKLGLVIGAKYFEVKTELQDKTLNFIESESVEGPVPVVGVCGELKLPAKFKLGCLARGLSVEVSDVDAKLYDIEAALHYDFNKFFRASAGYRYFMIDAEDTKDNDSVDIKFAGPYVGITGSF